MTLSSEPMSLHVHDTSAFTNYKIECATHEIHVNLCNDLYERANKILLNIKFIIIITYTQELVRHYIICNR